ncbi:TetR/AcrR family transcriptional regulator [Verrucomicrobiaceae bacterium 227]
MTPETTKDKVLCAAVSVFAEKSYRDATVAEICERAEANIAAINYHFGSKEKLLQQTLRHAFNLAEEKYPIRGSLNPGDPAEERLYAFMDAMIRRGFDSGPAGLFERIMSHEGTREAGNEVVFDEVNRLQGKHLSQILRELLDEPDEHTFHHARLNVIALCVFSNIAHKLSRLLFPNSPTKEDLSRYIDQQYRFALAGLAQLHPTARTTPNHA